MTSDSLTAMTRASAQPQKRRAYAARVPLEERRQQLLDSALRLIARDGYGGLTVEAIAAEAGVTKPVVYGIYAKLPLLLHDLLDRTQGDALEQLMAAFPKDAATSTTPAADVTRAWVRAVRSHPTTWAPILLIGANTPSVVLERIEAGREQVRAGVTRGLTRRSGADPEMSKRLEMAGHAIVAAAEHFGRLLLTAPESVDDDRLAELFESIAVGVAGKPAG